MKSSRIHKAVAVLSPVTLLKFYEALKRRKYRLLFSGQNKGKPGPKGPSRALIDLIVEMKRRNPRFGCPKIAQQISKAFSVENDKDVMRRVLAKYYRTSLGNNGPSWLTFIGHMKDSLWSVDLFRCESINITTHWVLVVMDQFTRRIIGFGVHRGDVDGVALCRMFNKTITRMGTPKYLSTDHDLLFKIHRWKANLRTLDVDEIKTVPYVPLSHPFVERLIGTARRDFLDYTLFWNVFDLERKLGDFKQYYNCYRVHNPLNGYTPAETSGEALFSKADLNEYQWQTYCHGLYQLPLAA